jgi:aspartate/methionine/tyrosine aminotransferase
MIDAVKSGDTHYTRGEGRESLCATWAEYLQHRWNIPVTGEGIVMTPGAKQALLYAMMVALDRDDEILLLDPAWPTYAEQAVLVGAKPISVPCIQPSFRPDMVALENAISHRTKALLINSPNNPTGAVYTPEEIQNMVDFAIRHDLWIISDEIYAELIWNGTPHISPASLPGGFERTLTVMGPSKTHAMTGWRVGVLAATNEVANLVGRIQGNTCSHIPSFIMPAAEVAAKEWDSVGEFRGDYIQKRKRMMDLIEQIPLLNAGEPEGAFYLMVDVRNTGMDAITFAARAMEEACVQVIPLEGIPGGEGYIRLSYAADDDVIEEGLKRLGEWLGNQ